MSATKKSIVDSADPTLHQIPIAGQNIISDVQKAAKIEIHPANSEPTTEKFSETVEALDTHLCNEHLEQKANLIGENISGIMQGKSLNNFLFEYYGFRIEAVDNLINDKLPLSNSLEATGTNNWIRSLEALKVEMTQNIGTAMDKLMGRGGKP